MSVRALSVILVLSAIAITGGGSAGLCLTPLTSSEDSMLNDNNCGCGLLTGTAELEQQLLKENKTYFESKATDAVDYPKASNFIYNIGPLYSWVSQGEVSYYFHKAIIMIEDRNSKLFSKGYLLERSNNRVEQKAKGSDQRPIIWRKPPLPMKIEQYDELLRSFRPRDKNKDGKPVEVPPELVSPYFVRNLRLKRTLTRPTGSSFKMSIINDQFNEMEEKTQIDLILDEYTGLLTEIRRSMENFMFRPSIAGAIEKPEYLFKGLDQESMTLIVVQTIIDCGEKCKNLPDLLELLGGLIYGDKQEETYASRPALWTKFRNFCALRVCYDSVCVAPEAFTYTDKKYIIEFPNYDEEKKLYSAKKAGPVCSVTDENLGNMNYITDYLCSEFNDERKTPKNALLGNNDCSKNEAFKSYISRMVTSIIEKFSIEEGKLNAPPVKKHPNEFNFISALIFGIQNKLATVLGMKLSAYLKSNFQLSRFAVDENYKLLKTAITETLKSENIILKNYKDVETIKMNKVINPDFVRRVGHVIGMSSQCSWYNFLCRDKVPVLLKKRLFYGGENPTLVLDKFGRIDKTSTDSIKNDHHCNKAYEAQYTLDYMAQMIAKFAVTGAVPISCIDRLKAQKHTYRNNPAIIRTHHEICESVIRKAIDSHTSVTSEDLKSAYFMRYFAEVLLNFKKNFMINDLTKNVSIPFSLNPTAFQTGFEKMIKKYDPRYNLTDLSAEKKDKSNQSSVDNIFKKYTVNNSEIYLLTFERCENPDYNAPKVRRTGNTDEYLKNNKEPEPHDKDKTTINCYTERSMVEIVVMATYDGVRHLAPKYKIYQLDTDNEDQLVEDREKEIEEMKNRMKTNPYAILESMVKTNKGGVSGSSTQVELKSINIIKVESEFVELRYACFSLLRYIGEIIAKTVKSTEVFTAKNVETCFSAPLDLIRPVIGPPEGPPLQHCIEFMKRYNEQKEKELAAMGLDKEEMKARLAVFYQITALLCEDDESKWVKTGQKFILIITRWYMSYRLYIITIFLEIIDEETVIKICTKYELNLFDDYASSLSCVKISFSIETINQQTEELYKMALNLAIKMDYVYIEIFACRFTALNVLEGFADKETVYEVDEALETKDLGFKSLKIFKMRTFAVSKYAAEGIFVFEQMPLAAFNIKVIDIKNFKIQITISNGSNSRSLTVSSFQRMAPVIGQQCNQSTHVKQAFDTIIKPLIYQHIIEMASFQINLSDYLEGQIASEIDVIGELDGESDVDSLDEMMESVDRNEKSIEAILKYIKMLPEKIGDVVTGITDEAGNGWNIVRHFKSMLISFPMILIFTGGVMEGLGYERVEYNVVESSLMYHSLEFANTKPLPLCEKFEQAEQAPQGAQEQASAPLGGGDDITGDLNSREKTTPNQADVDDGGDQNADDIAVILVNNVMVDGVQDTTSVRADQNVDKNPIDGSQSQNQNPLVKEAAIQAGIGQNIGGDGSLDKTIAEERINDQDDLGIGPNSTGVPPNRQLESDEDDANESNKSLITTQNTMKNGDFNAIQKDQDPADAINDDPDIKNMKTKQPSLDDQTPQSQNNGQTDMVKDKAIIDQTLKKREEITEVKNLQTEDSEIVEENNDDVIKQEDKDAPSKEQKTKNQKETAAPVTLAPEVLEILLEGLMCEKKAENSSSTASKLDTEMIKGRITNMLKEIGFMIDDADDKPFPYQNYHSSVYFDKRTQLTIRVGAFAYELVSVKMIMLHFRTVFFETELAVIYTNTPFMLYTIYKATKGIQNSLQGYLADAKTKNNFKNLVSLNRGLLEEYIQAALRLIRSKLAEGRHMSICRLSNVKEEDIDLTSTNPLMYRIINTGSSSTIESCEGDDKRADNTLEIMREESPANSNTVILQANVMSIDPNGSVEPIQIVNNEPFVQVSDKQRTKLTYKLADNDFFNKRQATIRNIINILKFVLRGPKTGSGVE